MIPTRGRREKPIKIGVEVVRHAKYVTYQFAKDAVPRGLFVAILERIQRFVVPEPAQADGFLVDAQFKCGVGMRSPGRTPRVSSISLWRPKPCLLREIQQQCRYAEFEDAMGRDRRPKPGRTATDIPAPGSGTAHSTKRSSQVEVMVRG